MLRRHHPSLPLAHATQQVRETYNVPPCLRPTCRFQQDKPHSPFSSRLMSACKNKQMGCWSVIAHFELSFFSSHRKLALDRIPVPGTWLKPSGLKRMTVGIGGNPSSLGTGEGKPFLPSRVLTPACPVFPEPEPHALRPAFAVGEAADDAQ